jgi:glycosyltransferase involved in cell wall biosynthesis
LFNSSSEDIRIKYNFPINKILVLVGANLEKRKGHIFLLEAICELKKEYYKDLNMHFIFAGDGAERYNINKYISDNDLESEVTMLGHINDIFPIINAVDILVLPSIGHEDFPYIILESMALSKAIIGTKVAGIPEQIIDNLNGYLVEPGCPRDLKIALQKFIENKTLIKEFGIEGKKIFDDKYFVKKIVKKYINLFKAD